MTRSMRRFSAILLLLAFGGCSKPDVAVTGGSWEDWEGKWLVVNYWAEWCAPCRKEIPELNELHHQSEDVIVLGVNFDGLQGQALADLSKEMGIEFPVLEEDPAGRWEQPRPTVLPSTFIIAPDGEFRDVLVGPQTYESLARAVELTTPM